MINPSASPTGFYVLFTIHSKTKPKVERILLTGKEKYVKLKSYRHTNAAFGGTERFLMKGGENMTIAAKTAVLLADNTPIA